MKGRPVLPPDDVINDLVKSHNRGLSNRQIARRVKRSGFCVAAWLKRLGLQTNRPWNRPFKQEQ